jgi:hypothetical protein
MSYQANKWTQEELDTVSDMFKEGSTYEQIHKSKKVSRSPFAIECKIVTLINDELQSGKSHKEVAKLFNRTKSEIKDLESRAFEIKNKPSATTQYTNDGGYEYKKKKTPEELLDLSEFQHINRVVGTVVHFYENISRLNRLHDENIIQDDFYKKLINKINDFEFDKDKIIQSIDFSNYKKSDNNDDNYDDNSSDKKSDKKNNKNDTNDNSSDKKEETKTLTKKKYGKRMC